VIGAFISVIVALSTVLTFFVLKWAQSEERYRVLIGLYKLERENTEYYRELYRVASKKKLLKGYKNGVEQDSRTQRNTSKPFRNR